MIPLKKFIALAAAVLLLGNCRADDPVSADKLPNAAKNFMAQHYPGVGIISVSCEKLVDD